MVKLVNRAKMKVASGGAGTLTLGTACDGYQTFAAGGVTDQDKLRYTITDDDNWEIGVGTYTATGTTLARAVTESSNSGNAITCSSLAEIFVTMTAEDFSGNAVPIFVNNPASSVNLKTDGTTAVTLDLKAVDDQSFPLNYDWDAWLAGAATIYDSSAIPPQLASAPVINQSTGAFGLVGSSDRSNAGIVNFRAKVSDGVRIATHVTALNLSFDLYSTGLLGRYDVKDSNSYVSGASTMYDLSGNSGPDLTVVTSKVTYAATGTGSHPTLSIEKEFEAIFTTTSFGTGVTCVMIAHGLLPFDGTTQAWWGKKPSANASGDRFFNAGVNTSGSSQYNTVVAQNQGSSSKVFIDKTEYDITSTPPTGLSRAAYTDLVYGTKHHSILYSDLNLSSGWSSGGTSSANAPEMTIRAILFYDHLPTQANINSIHNFFKADYSSDSDMAP